MIDRPPARGPSETSGARTPIDLLREEIRELRRETLGAVDRLDGKLSREIVESENRTNTRKESRAMAEISAQLTMSEKQRQAEKVAAEADAEAWRRLKKLLVRAVVAASSVAAVFLTAFLDRSCAHEEIGEVAKAAAVQTVDTIDTKAAALEREHAETRRLGERNSNRIDALESKLDQVLELLTRPQPAPAKPP